ncbi:MAG TPA: hypothetical protein VG710_03600 [Opitutus sp.]|nr:hypothetical protein [Opitutus sp.]
MLRHTHGSVAVALRARSLAGYGISAVGAVIIMALMLSTREIMMTRDIFNRAIRPFWVAALVAGLYSIYLAGCSHLVLGYPLLDTGDIEWNAVHAADTTQKVTIWLGIAFLAGSPIAVSYLMRRIRLDEETD